MGLNSQPRPDHSISVSVRLREILHRTCRSRELELDAIRAAATIKAPPCRSSISICVLRRFAFALPPREGAFRSAFGQLPRYTAVLSLKECERAVNLRLKASVLTKRKRVHLLPPELSSSYVCVISSCASPYRVSAHVDHIYYSKYGCG